MLGLSQHGDLSVREGPKKEEVGDANPKTRPRTNRASLPQCSLGYAVTGPTPLRVDGQQIPLLDGESDKRVTPVAFWRHKNFSLLGPYTVPLWLSLNLVFK